MNTKYSPEIKERAVRLLQEQRDQYLSQWAATVSIAAKIGCTPETLRTWAKVNLDQRTGNTLSASERQRLKELEKEVKELHRANEILRKAAAFFAQAELDRKPKR